MYLETNKKDLFLEAIELLGKEEQYGMFHEEMGETMQAINKYRRNPNEETLDHLAEEITDLEIMLGQIKTTIPEDRLEFWENIKLSRLKKLIEKTKQERKENLERCLETAGTRFELFQVLADKGLICTDGEMDEIMEAIAKDYLVVDPKELK